MLALVPLATVAFALFTAFPLFSSFQESLQFFLADHSDARATEQPDLQVSESVRVEGEGA